MAMIVGKVAWSILRPDNGVVIQGEWQCWNTLVGKWWATGGPVAQYATVDNPQPLGTPWARFPKLGINRIYSAVARRRAMAGAILWRGQPVAMAWRVTA